MNHEIDIPEQFLVSHYIERVCTTQMNKLLLIVLHNTISQNH